MGEEILHTIDNLKEYFREKKSVLVLFSGGVDSTVLAKIARDVLKKNAYALTIVQEYYPMYNLKIAKELSKKIGITHIIFYANFLKDYNIRKNDDLRCYYCKKLSIKIAKCIAKRLGIETIVEGTNIDDLYDNRPGIKALKEEGVESPYLKFNVRKLQIRMIAKYYGLENYNLPKNSCYATRILQDELSMKKLIVVNEIESLLFNSGIKCIRARILSDTIILETSEKYMKSLIDLKDKILELKDKYGYKNLYLNLIPRSED